MDFRNKVLILVVIVVAVLMFLSVMTIVVPQEPEKGLTMRGLDMRVDAMETQANRVNAKLKSLEERIEKLEGK